MHDHPHLLVFRSERRLCRRNPFLGEVSEGAVEAEELQRLSPLCQFLQRFPAMKVPVLGGAIVGVTRAYYVGGTMAFGTARIATDLTAGRLPAAGG